MSKLLINENPIMIQPTLVMKLGLNQAIIIQQVHYWLLKSPHIKDGKRWIYNSYKDWKQQFPFWSEKTISRVERDEGIPNYWSILNIGRALNLTPKEFGEEVEQQSKTLYYFQQNKEN